jgi:hypothetical protein
MTIDLADIHTLHLPARDDACRCREVSRDPERPGKIVGSAEGNDSEWQARLKQPGQRRVQCAVAPADDHAFDRACCPDSIARPQ